MYLLATWYMFSSASVFGLIFSFEINVVPWLFARKFNDCRDDCAKLNLGLICDLRLIASDLRYLLVISSSATASHCFIKKATCFSRSELDL